MSDTAAQADALRAYWRDRAATAKAAMEEADLMARTVQFLDDDGVRREYRNKIGRAERHE